MGFFDDLKEAAGKAWDGIKEARNEAIQETAEFTAETITGTELSEEEAEASFREANARTGRAIVNTGAEVTREVGGAVTEFAGQLVGVEDISREQARRSFEASRKNLVRAFEKTAEEAGVTSPQGGARAAAGLGTVGLAEATGTAPGGQVILVIGGTVFVLAASARAIQTGIRGPTIAPTSRPSDANRRTARRTREPDGGAIQKTNPDKPPPEEPGEDGEPGPISKTVKRFWDKVLELKRVAVPAGYQAPVGALATFNVFFPMMISEYSFWAYFILNGDTDVKAATMPVINSFQRAKRAFKDGNKETVKTEIDGMIEDIETAITKIKEESPASKASRQNQINDMRKRIKHVKKWKKWTATCRTDGNEASDRFGKVDLNASRELVSLEANTYGIGETAEDRARIATLADRRDLRDPDRVGTIFASRGDMDPIEAVTGGFEALPEEKQGRLTRAFLNRGGFRLTDWHSVPDLETTPDGRVIVQSSWPAERILSEALVAYSAGEDGSTEVEVISNRPGEMPQGITDRVLEGEPVNPGEAGTFEFDRSDAGDPAFVEYRAVVDPFRGEKPVRVRHPKSVPTFATISEET